MNKKILILTVTAFTLVAMTLPMISTAQAWQGGIPTEIYDDLQVWGMIKPDYNPVPEVRGNIQYASYTAQCYAGMSPVKWIGIFWDDGAQSLTGNATYEIDYKINLNTMHGVVRLKTVVTLPDGTFEGDMFWNGELQFRSDYLDTVNLVSGMWHVFWRGTSAYDGWTIVMNMNGHPDNFVSSVHLIVR